MLSARLVLGIYSVYQKEWSIAKVKVASHYVGTSVVYIAKGANLKIFVMLGILLTSRKG